jgi:hypothetical protein
LSIASRWAAMAESAATQVLSAAALAAAMAALMALVGCTRNQTKN